MDDQARTHLLPGSHTQVINGLAVAVQPFSETNHSFVAVFDSLGIVVTVTWSSHQDVAQQILSSVHGA